MGKEVLSVKDLRTYFYTDNGLVKAVDGVDFAIEEGKTLAIVGESGCGKSVTSKSVMRIVPTPPGEIADGEIIFDGKSILDLSEKQMRDLRGNDMAMIFQEPMTALNPVFTIEYQLSEALMLHKGLSKEEAKAKGIELLKKVGIPNPTKVIEDFPFALSGGMRQRVMIAMALACDPKLLIADEPTTALDVTIQAQVLELMKDLQKEFNTAIMFITHDLGVVAEIADRVVVMYSGKVVEEADAPDLFANPNHPYTIGLLNSMPDLATNDGKLYAIPGVVPNPLYRPAGCQFCPRCEKAMSICAEKEPELKVLDDGRKVRCWLFEEGR